MAGWGRIVPPGMVGGRGMSLALVEQGLINVLGVDDLGLMLLLVKDGGVAFDSCVSGLSPREPFLRIRFSDCTAMCGHRGEQE